MSSHFEDIPLLQESSRTTHGENKVFYRRLQYKQQQAIKIFQHQKM